MTAVAVMSAPPTTAPSRLLMSGNEAVARAVWEAGVRVAAAYPGTPATEMLECVAGYREIYAEWSVNEKVSLEVAFGAAMAGSRSFCAMKHVGMNVASDALMTMTLTGVAGGLVIAIADDVGLSSSQNEQDSRFWGRFAHVPVLEPADSQEAHDFTLAAFALSERFETPVILRLTTRICHVKGLVRVGERSERPVAGFTKDVGRWVMVPSAAGRRLPLMFDRERRLRAEAEISELNVVEPGRDRRVGFVTSGPAYMHVRESFPDAPVFKLGFSFPLPFDSLRQFATQCDRLVVVEEVEPLIETELKAQGINVSGKDILPRSGELSPQVLKPAVARLLGEARPRTRRNGADAGLSAPPDDVRRLSASGGVLHAVAIAQRHHLGRHRLLHPWASASRGTRSTPASRWALRWAWRWASTKDAATLKKTGRSSP
jgi:indolepyruvate ferredoxin oxidoreductase alpha subunit